MSFSNLFFPFVFLPCALLLYGLTPQKLKNFVLVLISLSFYAWSRPIYVLLLILSIFFNYFTAREIEQLEIGRRRRRVFISGVVLDLALLAFFKYWGFLIASLGSLLGADWVVNLPPSPVGISFFTFSVLSYLFDVYRGRVRTAGSLLDCAVYVSLFPKLISGPIVSWKELEPQLREHPVTSELAFRGGRRFLVGLSKKVLLANTLGTSFYLISAKNPGSLSMLTAWIGALSYSMMLYFDFSGYSDMAIGLGQMFGFELPENFQYPYAGSSMTDFWRTWHVSLGAWFREYVYIPLGGSREGRSKTIRNLAVVWMLTGLWHGANWTFVFWGIYHGSLLILEKFLLKSFVEKLPNWLRHLLTVVLAVIGWVFFFSPSLGSAVAFLGSMFSGPLTDSFGRYCLSGSWLVLLVSGIGCFPFPRIIAQNLFHSQSPAVMVVNLAFFGILVYFCVAGMLSDTYASFLYFQF